MHELSIALNIVDIASRETEKAGATKVEQLELEVGSLSGVVIEALEFALKEAVRNSVLESSEIIISEVEARCRCNQCGLEYKVEALYDICPDCHSADRTILQGQEMLVKTMQVV
jgi:hydrogenase nickel incorporation protein HypA/HybF